MSDVVLVKVENVSKKFCRTLKRSLWYGVQDVAGEMLGRRGSHGELRPGEFWAVNNVSFELKRGECIGLIGHNGAGKTTLLRMLNGLIKPDSGRIEMKGRIGALIALGAGFNPILTGRENIYVNASVLGLRKREIDEKLDEIIDFAEIGDFIDAPVQSYSSGMQVKLGFAVATILKPDVLLLDEVLAVGDVAFRAKCYKRIDELREQAAVIFVSHDLASIARLSNNVMLLKAGEVVSWGGAGEAIGKMEDSLRKRFVSEMNVNQCIDPIEKFNVLPAFTVIPQKEKFRLKININTVAPLKSVQIWISLQDFVGNHVAECVLDNSTSSHDLNGGNNSWELVFYMLPLRAGTYSWQVTLVDHYRRVLAVSRNESHVLITTDGMEAHVSSCALPLKEKRVLI